MAPGNGGWNVSEGDLAHFGSVRDRVGEDVLQHLVRGLVLALHLVHGGLDGDDAVHADRSVINHIGGRHRRGLVVRRRAGEGIFGRSGFGGGAVR